MHDEDPKPDWKGEAAAIAFGITWLVVILYGCWRAYTGGN